mmetsp:Transcript_26130/g.46466  ORF Transcript_26130/g.46466 Transcript_26130/m.46466 type:complete len:235 (-) Transcript_26130:80-784(-)
MNTSPSSALLKDESFRGGGGGSALMPLLVLLLGSVKGVVGASSDPTSSRFATLRPSSNNDCISCCFASTHCVSLSANSSHATARDDAFRAASLTMPFCCTSRRAAASSPPRSFDTASPSSNASVFLNRSARCAFRSPAAITSRRSARSASTSRFSDSTLLTTRARSCLRRSSSDSPSRLSARTTATRQGGVRGSRRLGRTEHERRGGFSESRQRDACSTASTGDARTLAAIYGS